MSSRRLLRLLALVALPLAALAGGCHTAGNATPGVQVATHPPRTSATPTAIPLPTAAPGDPWLLPVGKDLALPDAYIPPDLVDLPPNRLAASGKLLRREAAAALEEWLSAAGKAGYDVKILSAFRSYEEQVSTHQEEVDRVGATEAARSSALPGHSEHQLGTTVDLTAADVGWDLRAEFGDTPEGRWLAETAADYGFVMSYPQGSEPVTGYEYEPWHFRYVGRAHALAVRQEGVTLLEHLQRAQAAVAGG